MLLPEAKGHTYWLYVTPFTFRYVPSDLTIVSFLEENVFAASTL
jgi:hypothetical protein